MIRVVTASGGAARATPHDDLDHWVRTELDTVDAGSPGADSSRAGDNALLSLFDAMAASRLLDVHARRMREHGRGYYTIGSSGHESNAYVAAATRPTDRRCCTTAPARSSSPAPCRPAAPWTPHYGRCCSRCWPASRDAASAGRHKVWGDAALAVIPQTSTIASHLPRSLGVAMSMSRARRLGVPCRWPSDALTVCSFGDASLNHSTAVGALNAGRLRRTAGPAACRCCSFCEDTGIGISVPTPNGWVAAAAQRPGLDYVYADGDSPDGAREAASSLADTVRRTRRPALLHLRTVRFLSHAGSDVETAYRPAAELAAERERDPLVALARRLGGGYDLAGRVRAGRGTHRRSRRRPRVDADADVRRTGDRAARAAQPAGDRDERAAARRAGAARAGCSTRSCPSTPAR